MNQQNLGRSTGNIPEIHYKSVVEKYKINLAKGVLLGVAILFVASAILWVFRDMPGKDIFETAKTILPPIALLVLGYYFGQKE